MVQVISMSSLKNFGSNADFSYYFSINLYGGWQKHANHCTNDTCFEEFYKISSTSETSNLALPKKRFYGNPYSKWST